MTIDTTASALTAEQHATLETFYGAFTRKNPDLLDEAVTSGWQDIPLAPGQGPGPAGLKPIILGFIESLPDVEIVVDEVIGFNDRARRSRPYRRHPTRRALRHSGDESPDRDRAP